MHAPQTISPSYVPDLRVLVHEAFADATLVSAKAVRGGTISDRLRGSAWPAPGLIYPAECTDIERGGSTSPVGQAEYWSLALPWRLIVHGPLLELAREDLAPGERLKAEEAILKTYREIYQCVPLPPRVLGLIRSVRRRAPYDDLPGWLDVSMDRAMGTPTFEDVLTARRSLRIEALLRGASGAWRQESVAVAELMSDVFVICRAAKADVDRAQLEAPAYGGSVALALSAIDDQQATTFEVALQALVQPALSAEDLPAAERESIIAFTRRREPVWQKGLLGERSGEVERVSARNPEPDAERSPGMPKPPDEGEKDEPAENARDLYRRLKTSLEEKIIGRPALCRHLALIGAAHLLGVTHQRLLLVGPSGSGKTHAVRALAESLERPHMQVDASDLTATGWRGAELNDLLEGFARRAGGSLAGAILQLDELDKAACLDPQADGNSREAKLNLQASLLALCDGNPVSPDSVGKEQLETAALLVIATGAFAGKFVHTPPTTEDLVRWGWIPEFAARWGERLCLAPPSRGEAVELLRQSERSAERRLGPLLRAAGIELDVTNALLGYVADLWITTGTDFRTANEWVLVAARRRLIHALETGTAERIILAPDDIAAVHRSIASQ